MVDIREMRMGMGHRFVTMRMDVRFFSIPGEIMFVLVMRIVRMLMGMRHHFMRVFMHVSLRQMQPNPCPHERGGNPDRATLPGSRAQPGRPAFLKMACSRQMLLPPTARK
jgi:hypothetical protein